MFRCLLQYLKFIGGKLKSRTYSKLLSESGLKPKLPKFTETIRSCVTPLNLSFPLYKIWFIIYSTTENREEKDIETIQVGKEK